MAGAFNDVVRAPREGTGNSEPSSSSAKSVPAIVTFWLLGLWTFTIVAAVILTGLKIEVDSTILIGVIGSQTTLTVSAVSFWVGTTVGAKAAGDKIAAQAETSSAALAQLAGAGAPPPAAPLSPEPAPASAPAAAAEPDWIR